MLSREELERYKRNIMVEDLGWIGQKRLKESKVFVVGAGGLGSPVLLYLVAAGVGEVIVQDGDLVDLSNLQRQIIYDENSLGKKKTEAVYQKLKALNSEVKLVVFDSFFSEDMDLTCDAVAVCTDSLESRIRINKWAVKRGIPGFYGGIAAWYGQVFTVIPGQGPCLNCIMGKMKEPPVKGVLGPTAGVAGCLQAVEIIKHLTGQGASLVGKVLHFDLLAMDFQLMPVGRNEECEVCGNV